MNRPGILRQVGLRFLSLYLLLVVLPGPIIFVPGLGWLNEFYEAPWTWLVTHLGPLVVHGPVAVGMGGDSRAEYLRTGIKLTAAALITLGWTWRSRSPRFDARMAPWIRLLLRYDLAATMLGYGLSKVFKVQFPAPGPNRLIEPLGQMSPMGLLWTFMGYSTPYTIFGGLAEGVGSVLLFFRRTTTLGALILAAVLANVVMLNLCYDVPVKIWSAHLLVMAVFLASRDGRRLANVLLFDRPTGSAPEPPVLEGRRGWRRASIAVKVILIAVLIGMPSLSNWTRLHMMGDAAPKGPFYGIYEVDSFQSGTGAQPAAQPWKRLAVNQLRMTSVQFLNDQTQVFALRDNPANHELSLRSPSGTVEHFSYRWTDPNVLELEGTWQKSSLKVRLRRVDWRQTPLISRGFHWINEMPFNR